jgi:hypothetical protein
MHRTSVRSIVQKLSGRPLAWDRWNLAVQFEQFERKVVVSPPPYLCFIGCWLWMSVFIGGGTSELKVVKPAPDWQIISKTTTSLFKRLKDLFSYSKVVRRWERCFRFCTVKWVVYWLCSEEISVQDGGWRQVGKALLLTYLLSWN